MGGLLAIGDHDIAKLKRRERASYNRRDGSGQRGYLFGTLCLDRFGLAARKIR